jgi:hypothetical protein
MFQRNYLQGRRINQSRKQRKISAFHLLSRWFLAWLILRPWIWRRYVPPKRPLHFNGLHGVTSQKTELFNLIICLILLKRPRIKPANSVNEAFISEYAYVYLTVENEVKVGKLELQTAGWKVTHNCHNGISNGDGCNPACATWHAVV